MRRNPDGKMDKKDYWFKAQAVVRKGKHEKVLTIAKCELDLSQYASCDSHAGGELTLQMPVCELPLLFPPPVASTETEQLRHGSWRLWGFELGRNVHGGV